METNYKKGKRKLLSIIVGLAFYLSVLPLLLKWIWNIYILNHQINYVGSLVIVVFLNILLSIYLTKRKRRKQIEKRLSILEEKINID